MNCLKFIKIISKQIVISQTGTNAQHKIGLRILVTPFHPRPLVSRRKKGKKGNLIPSILIESVKLCLCILRADLFCLLSQ